MPHQYVEGHVALHAPLMQVGHHSRQLRRLKVGGTAAAAAAIVTVTHPLASNTCTALLGSVSVGQQQAYIDWRYV
jgi:hypothetical protein